jgi:hypothetical protein
VQVAVMCRLRLRILPLGIAALLGPGLRSASAQDSAKAGACEVSFALAQLDPGVMKLLSTPAVPPVTTSFTAVSMRPIKQWDLPSKVTAWQERPSTADLNQRWDELGRGWYGGGKDKTSGVPASAHRPYQALAAPQKDWNELRQWMAKDGPKQLAGTCVEEKEARYLMVVGAIRDASGAVAGNATRDLDYAQYAGAPRQESMGPNAATVSPTGHQSVHDEMSSHDAVNDPSVYACVFLYRTAGASGGEAGARGAAPAYYYCHAASSLKSSVTTMLKYLAKNGLP